MNGKHIHFNEIAGSKLLGLGTSLMLLLICAVLIYSPSTQAFWYHADRPQVSDALEANGFETLKFALDTTGLTPVLDSNRVTIFAPTNDVFESTALALGCTDAVDLATRLLNIPVGESNALAAILSHHAVLNKISSKYTLLDSSPIPTANGDSVVTGVDSKGLFVQGVANDAASSITAEGIRGRHWVIYPIDAILLPFAPPADLCS